MDDQASFFIISFISYRANWTEFIVVPSHTSPPFAKIFFFFFFLLKIIGLVISRVLSIAIRYIEVLKSRLERGGGDETKHSCKKILQRVKSHCVVSISVNIKLYFCCAKFLRAWSTPSRARASILLAWTFLSRISHKLVLPFIENARVIYTFNYSDTSAFIKKKKNRKINK